jgi:hypothetical protein
MELLSFHKCVDGGDFFALLLISHLLIIMPIGPWSMSMDHVKEWRGIILSPGCITCKFVVRKTSC